MREKDKDEPSIPISIYILIVSLSVYHHGFASSSHCVVLVGVAVSVAPPLARSVLQSMVDGRVSHEQRLAECN
jgi:hypothetical protein